MLVKEYNEKKEDFIYLKLPMKDAGKFFSYSEQIKKRLLSNEPVPLRFYNKMMSLIIPKERDKEEYYNKTVEELTKNIVAYFSNHRAKKKYLFSVNRKEIAEDIPNKDGTKNVGLIKVNYSFEKMVECAVFEAVHTYISGKRNKEEIIVACYKGITDYVFKDNKNISKVISHYAATVVSGYITMKFDDFSADFQHDSGVYFINDEIYNVVHHWTDPYNVFPEPKKKKHK
jgi:hypothetical protein